MRRKIIIMVTDESVGVQGLPDDVEVEVRFYGTEQLERVGANEILQDETGRWYVAHVFGDEA